MMGSAGKLIVLFLLGGMGFLLSAADLVCPDYAVQGSGMTVFIATDSQDSFSGGELTLIRGNGTVISRSRFFLFAPRDSWCSLLGIPADLKEGTYTLSCRLESEEGTVTLQKRLGVTGHEFPSETLKLNRNLTNIRTEEDPRKTAQAEELWSVLGGFDGDSCYFDGRFTPPLDSYRVTTDFGTRRIYEYDDGSEAGTLHNGWDWAAPTGSPVKAVGKGRVVLAKERIVTGNTVILELLPGVYMLYYHLDELQCTEGDVVEAGDIVGTVGMTGLATGPHLHWELRISRVAVDPLPFLDTDLIDKTLFFAKM
ncbi:MAG: M23 family metallopeptidase [Spirochaetales bacterium]|nr:M23 family metallopeptidase [Spirochaetales bacterium]